MPETLGALAVEVGGWFAADAAFGGVAAGLTAEEAAGMGIVAGSGELSSTEAAALVAGGGGAEAVGGAGMGAALGDAGAGAAGMGITDATGGLLTEGGELGGFGLGQAGAMASPETMGSAIAGAGGTSGVAPTTAPGTLESLFGPKGTLSSLFAKGGMGTNIMQLASGGYGLLNAMQLGRMATRPNKLGQQAVMRSMASQGYQGSGNMMAALSQYGINGSQAAASAGMGPLVGAMSSLGLISGGIQGMFSQSGG